MISRTEWITEGKKRGLSRDKILESMERFRADGGAFSDEELPEGRETNMEILLVSNDMPDHLSDEEIAKAKLKLWYKHNGETLNEAEFDGVFKSDFGDTVSYSSVVNNLKNIYQAETEEGAAPLGVSLNDKGAFMSWLHVAEGGVSRVVTKASEGTLRSQKWFWDKFNDSWAKEGSRMEKHLSEYSELLERNANKLKKFGEYSYTQWTEDVSDEFKQSIAGRSAGLFAEIPNILLFLNPFTSGVALQANYGRMFQEGYDSALEAGKSKEQAQSVGASTMIINGTIESLMDAMMAGVGDDVLRAGRAMSVKEFFKRTGITAAKSQAVAGMEGFTEILQSGVTQKLATGKIDARQAFQEGIYGWMIATVTGGMVGGAKTVDAQRVHKTGVEGLSALGADKKVASSLMDDMLNAKSKEEQQEVADRMADVVMDSIAQSAPWQMYALHYLGMKTGPNGLVAGKGNTVITPPMWKRLGRFLDIETLIDIDGMDGDPQIKEVFIKAVKGDISAQTQYNEFLLGKRLPEEMQEQMAVGAKQSAQRQSMTKAQDDATVKKAQAILLSKVQKQADEFMKQFPELLPLEQQELFERTWYNRIKNQSEDTLTVEDLAFLEQYEADSEILETDVWYHGTRGGWTEWDSDVAGGLINLTKDRVRAVDYAHGAGGGRSKINFEAPSFRDNDDPSVIYSPKESPDGGSLDYVDSKTGEVISSEVLQRYVENGVVEPFYLTSEVKKFVATVKNPLDLRTKAGIGVLSSLNAKSKHAKAVVHFAKEGRFNWGETKFEHMTKHWKDELIPQLKKLGYDAIQFFDDGHETMAVFSQSQLRPISTSALSGRTQEYLNKWESVRNSLFERLSRAAEKRGDDVSRLEDFFPFRLREEEATVARVLNEMETLAFGSVLHRKQGVSMDVFETNPDIVLRDYIEGLVRYEAGAEIAEKANNVNINDLAVSLEIISKYGDSDLGDVAPEIEEQLEASKRHAEYVASLLASASTLGLTLDLEFLDETMLKRLSDLSLSSKKDVGGAMSPGEVFMEFDNLKIGSGGENRVGGATKLLDEIVTDGVQNKNIALSIETRRLAEIFSSHGLNFASKRDMLALFELYDKYGPESFQKGSEETFANEHPEDVAAVRDAIQFMDDVAKRHGYDPSKSYAMHRQDQAYWSDSFTEQNRDSFGSLLYSGLTRILNHAYMSEHVRRLRLYQKAAEQAGYKKFARYVDRYLQESLTGDISAIDAGLGFITVGGDVQKMMKAIQRVRNRAHLVGNFGYLFSTQWSSINLTLSRAGLGNTIKGVLLAMNPTSANMVIRGGFEGIKSLDISNPVFEATGLKETGTPTGFSREVDKIMTAPHKQLERYLTRTAVLAVYMRSKQLGMSTQDALVYADVVGSETQSMYSKELRPLALHSDFAKTLFPHESFAFTLFNQWKSILTDSGIPLAERERLLQGIRLLMGSLIMAILGKQAVGRWYYTPGSAVPWAGSTAIDPAIESFLAKTFPADTEAGRWLREYGPINRFSSIPSSEISLQREGSMIYKSVRDMIKYKNPKRFYKTMISYGLAAGGIGGGSQFSRMVDVLYAVNSGGDVLSPDGKKLFEIENNEIPKALLFGVYTTDGGQEYIEGVKDKKKRRKKKVRPMIR